MGGQGLRAAMMVVAVTLGAACAHHPPAPTAPARAGGRHGARGAAEPIALPHRVLDGERGRPLEEGELADRIGAARVIYVGEEHPDPHHHAAQLEVLAAVYEVDPSVGLGLEMLPRSMQPALDEYVAGRLDEAGFLSRVDWAHTWGFPFGLYRPLLAFCRDRGLRAYALNAPRALTRAVAKQGIERLPPELAALLPQLEPGPPAHRELVREAFGGHPHGRFADAAFERFYAAQLIWDETMAERVAAILSEGGGPRRLVVLAGDHHLRPFGVPARVARRGVTDRLIILPVLERDQADARRDRVADLLWVLDPG